MKILNFTHPLTSENLDSVKELTKAADLEVIFDEVVHFDEQISYGEQVGNLLSRVDLSASAWQTEKLLIVLPGQSSLAAAVLASIHGRRGHFVSFIRLRRSIDSLVTQFDVAEIINLDNIRDKSREARVS